MHRRWALSGVAPATLTEDEIAALVERCPEEHRWAFGGWLRGERLLDGDPIERVS